MLELWNKTTGIQAVRLADTDDLTEEQWLDIRRKGIGGSDIGAICGQNPWRSPIDVYLDKIKLKVGIEETERMYWGKVLEPVIATEYAKRTGNRTHRVNAILQHPEIEYEIADIDRLIVSNSNAAGNGVLEIKNTSFEKIWEDGVPNYYALQGQWYLDVTGLDYVEFAVFINGNHLEVVRIDRDEEIIAFMRKIARDFWEHVKKKVPPDPDGNKASSEVLKFLYPKAKKGTVITLPDEAAELINQYNEAKALKKKYEVKETEAQNKLLSLIGDNECGILKDYKVSWKNISGTRLDTNRLKTENPEVYKKYAKEYSSRRFSISKKSKLEVAHK